MTSYAVAAEVAKWESEQRRNTLTTLALRYQDVPIYTFIAA